MDSHHATVHPRGRPSTLVWRPPDLRSHVDLYSANVAGFGDLANLVCLPGSGGFVVALPTEIRGGSGAALPTVVFVSGGAA